MRLARKTVQFAFAVAYETLRRRPIVLLQGESLFKPLAHMFDTTFTGENGTCLHENTQMALEATVHNQRRQTHSTLPQTQPHIPITSTSFPYRTVRWVPRQAPSQSPPWRPLRPLRVGLPRLP